MTRTFGPENASLEVRTKRTGAAAMAGHDLVIQVTSWEATLDPGAGTVVLTADPRSLRVLEGNGGMQALGDDDKTAIEQTIDAEVLKGRPIEFRARDVEVGPDGSGSVRGELELAGERRPLAFELVARDGRLTATAVVRQSDWGLKPYSALFGTLKVVDEVEIAVDTGAR